MPKYYTVRWDKIDAAMIRFNAAALLATGFSLRVHVSKTPKGIKCYFTKKRARGFHGLSILKII